MKLSMHILADGLQKYHPEADIKSNNRNLQNVRLFSENLQFSSSTAYLMPMQFDRVVCSNGNDILTLHTDDINGVLNDILDLFEHYNAFEDRIDSLIAIGCSAHELLKELSDQTGFLFILADATFYIREAYGPEKIAASHHNLKQIIEKRMLPVDALKNINSSEEIRRPDIPSYLLTVPGLGSALITNLFCRNHHMGWLVTCNENFIFSEGERDLIDSVGALVSEWMETDRSQEERSQRTGIFLDLLTDTASKRPLERLESFGWYPQDEKQIYVITQNEYARLPLQTLNNHIDNGQNGLFSFFLEDNLVLITNHALLDPGLFTDQLADLLQSFGYAAGESPVFVSMDRLKDNYQAAKLAARYATAEFTARIQSGAAASLVEKNPERTLDENTAPDFPGKNTGSLKGRRNLSILRFQEAIIPYSVSILKEHAAADLKHPAIELLRRYDELHNSILLETLKVFLEENCSHSAAAKKLFIHRSTLIYRMEKIESLTGIDFSVADERFHLLLSFYLEKGDSYRL